MALHHSGELHGKGVRPAIIAGRYNQPIVEKLVEGAIQGFQEHGVNSEDIQVFWVPGAFEIPMVAGQAARSRKFSCIVCVGCVIQGDTFHFEHIAWGVSTGIAQVSRETGIPVIFSVLLSDDSRKAWERAGGTAGNRGYEGALAALEMTDLLRKIK